MSYNGSGTYVPPAGQPVATGTVIQSSAFNTLVADIGNTFNNALPRDGQASMVGPLKITDGTSSVPGIAFNSEVSSGIFRPVAGTLALVASGVENLRINNAGRVLIGTATDDGTNTLQVNGPAKVTGAATFGSTLSASSLSVANNTVISGRTLMGGATDDTVTQLQVSNAGGSLLSMNTTNVNGGFLKFSNSGTVTNYVGSGKSIVTNTNAVDLALRSETGAIVFANGANERVRVSSTGNLLVGTSTDTGAKLVVSGTVQASSDASFGSASVITSAGSGAYNSIVVGGDAVYKGTSSTIPVTVAMHNGSAIRLSTSIIQFRTNNAGTDAMQVSSNGNLLINTTTDSPAKLNVNGAVLIGGNTTTHTQGAWLEWNKNTGDGSTWLLNQKGNGNGGIVFGEVDTANTVTERARIDLNGKLLVGRTTDDGTGNKLQVVGGASVSGNVNISSGNLSLTGLSLLGGATGTYTSYSSAATVNYTGSGTQYGIALKPSVSTSDTYALAFLTGASTYASAGVVGTIQHRANDAALNLTGTWQVNGNPIASTNAPTITNPTIVGYIEQFQSLNPGATVTINPGAGTLIEVSITANTTITLPAASAGLSYTIIASYTGAYSLTFAGGTNIRWAGGSAPVATSASGKSDKYVFTCGSTYTLAQDGGRSF